MVIRAKASKLLQTLREHRGEKGEVEFDFRRNHLQRLLETDGLRDEVSSDCDAAESPSLLTTGLLLVYYWFTAVPNEASSDYDADSQSRMTRDTTLHTHLTKP